VNDIACHGGRGKKKKCQPDFMGKKKGGQTTTGSVTTCYFNELNSGVDKANNTEKGGGARGKGKGAMKKSITSEYNLQKEWKGIHTCFVPRRLKWCNGSEKGGGRKSKWNQWGYHDS